ncbi:DUF3786 domain-containing protein [Acetobacterium sp.]|jgi:hypothetical protein|uniref:DUF3786 domain-containing protein n=1 Tax=Acetobacterium sp. TaxID=1872094 RepID=UPI00271AB6AA|nr:DUF3786 domain-containing protein [Acetobacterium sp.]MDO9491777.1 DUF3786 domain-containing protein [Acetobacterium sp.]
MTSSYDVIYEALLPKLAKCDLAESAARFGLNINPNGDIIINFLKRGYRITNAGVMPLDGKPVNTNNRSILIHYVLSQGTGDPVYSFKPLFRMTTVFSSGDTGKASMMDAPLIKAFGDDVNKLDGTIIKLGGKSELSKEPYSQCWLLEVLPKIPVKIIYREADEDFPVEIQTQFDVTALEFLEFECLAFLCSCLVRALTKTAEYGTVDGWE